jgi:hypothetical protein
MVDRGSKRHVLDWTEQPKFADELLELLRPVQCRLTPNSDWQPKGYAHREEARLSRFGPIVLPGIDWSKFASWWLRHGGSTPTWDIAMQCDIEGCPGLVLVEAKAHASELSKDGKRLAKEDAANPRSERSVAESAANHEQIGIAIREAQNGLATLIPGIRIDRDRHFQLSNRLAFGWKLATMGIPTVLLYLGFTGDEGMRNKTRTPFADDADWQSTFRQYLTGVCPPSVLDGPLEVRKGKLWVLSRCRPVVTVSPAISGTEMQPASRRP